MIKYSIVVPIYNVEKYIYECLESICSQTLEKDKYEVILVNDGTKDGSMGVIGELVRNNSNVHIINQDNMGLGGARNTGIDSSSGEYIIFLDSDDFFANNNVLTKIDTILENKDIDILCYNHFVFDEIKQKKSTYKVKSTFRINDITNNEKRIKKMISNDMFSISAWSKVVRKKLLIDNNIYFNSMLSEDVDWSARLLLFTNKIYYLNEAINVYRINRPGSITSSKEKVFNNLKNAVKNANGYYMDNAFIKSTVYLTYVNTVFKSLVILYFKGKLGLEEKQFLREYKAIGRHYYDFKSFVAFLLLILIL